MYTNKRNFLKMATATLLATTAISGAALADSQPVGDRVEINGMQMYYEVSGKGDPMIVLHGVGVHPVRSDGAGRGQSASQASSFTSGADICPAS